MARARVQGRGWRVKGGVAAAHYIECGNLRLREFLRPAQPRYKKTRAIEAHTKAQKNDPSATDSSCNESQLKSAKQQAINNESNEVQIKPNLCSEV
jgi:hypothetical protein